MSNLESYLEDKNILYIYETGLSIYGIDADKRYLLICNTIPESFQLKEEPYYTLDEFDAVTIQDWFHLVEIGDIKAWECACLPKKSVIKEHVKLLLLTNPLQLRKNYEEKLNKGVSLFEYAKTVIFSNQIIENHKIVNFKAVGKIYPECSVGLDLTDEIERFKRYTDSALKEDKIKRILAKNENI